MINWIKKIWNDSVGSKVIATGITLFLSQIGLYIWGLIANIKFLEVYSNIFKFFKTEYNVKGWYLFFLYAIILGLIVWIFYKLRNFNKRKAQQETEKPELKTEEPEQFEIREAPTSFFHYRFCDAFPGFSRGYQWFDTKKQIHNRLSILLQKPISFDSGDGHGIDRRPIWWFRGSSASPIEKFEILNWGKCLLNIDELKIEKIAAYRGTSYYQDFVYVQCQKDKPTGLYKHDPDFIQEQYDNNGDYQEEFGIFKGRFITRQEYDDGSAIIRGKPVRTEGAALRSRNLTKYNFIIAAKFSPYNCNEFCRESKEYFGKLLREEIDFDVFVDWMKQFEKNHYDY